MLELILKNYFSCLSVVRLESLLLVVVSAVWEKGIGIFTDLNGKQ